MYRQSIITKTFFIVSFIFFYTLWADQSFGQDHLSKNNITAKSDSKWSSLIRGGYVYQFDTDIDNGNGNFTTDRFFIQPEIRYSPDRTISYSFSFGYGYDAYNFKGNKGFGALDPWSDIHSFRLSAPIRFTKGYNWSFFIAPTLRVTGESGVDLKDSFTGGVFTGFAYRINERLTLGPGVGFISQIEDDASIFPVLIINWKITDTLSLETGRGLGATLGPGISIKWQISEQWNLTLGGRYEKLRFRLDDRAETPNGIGQDESFPIFSGITYNINSSARLSLIGGFETSGELQLEDQNSNVLNEQDYESAAFGGFSFYYRF
jgi:hypothetical protein